MTADSSEQFDSPVLESTLVTGEERQEEEEEKEGALCRPSKRHALGVLVLLATVAIWVLSGELIQFIYDSVDFDQPFFLTYYSTALFSVYLTGFLFMPSWKCSSRQEKSFPEAVAALLGLQQHKEKLSPRQPQSPAPTPAEGEETFGTRRQVRGRGEREGSNVQEPYHAQPWVEEEHLGEVTAMPPPEREAEAEVKEEAPKEKASAWETAKVAVLFCPVWFLANWSYNLSLSHTSVASSTILASSSGLWTLVLAAVIGAEKFSWFKLLAVVVTLGGVVCVAATDASGEGTELWGDLAALFSAVCYAVYVVMLKVKIKDESHMHNAMFFGFVGIINVLTLWPVGIFLNLVGLDSFELPSWSTLGYLTLNGLIGTVLSDYLWLLSVLLTSPVVATLGLSLTIPGSMVADAIIHGSTFAPLYVTGSLLVLVGFVIVNGDSLWKSLWRRMLNTVKS